MSNVYKCTIESTCLAESKEKKTPSIRIKLKAYYSYTEGDACDKTFYADLWLTEAAAKRSLETLRKIGYQQDTLEAVNEGVLNGFQCEAVTEWEESNGIQKERVKYVNEAGDYEKRGLGGADNAASKRISDRYSAILRNTAKKPSRAVKAMQKLGAEPVATADEDEDPPF